MAEKVVRVGVQREEGYLYYINKDGDICRALQARGCRDKGEIETEKVRVTRIKKEPGYLYFLDKEGDISRAMMKRGR